MSLGGSILLNNSAICSETLPSTLDTLRNNSGHPASTSLSTHRTADAPPPPAAGAGAAADADDAAAGGGGRSLDRTCYRYLIDLLTPPPSNHRSRVDITLPVYVMMHKNQTTTYSLAANCCCWWLLCLHCRCYLGRLLLLAWDTGLLVGRCTTLRAPRTYSARQSTPRRWPPFLLRSLAPCPYRGAPLVLSPTSCNSKLGKRWV